MANFTDIPAELRLLIFVHYFTGRKIEYRKRNSDTVKHPAILFVSKTFISTSEMRHLILKHAIIHMQDIKTLEIMKTDLNLNVVERSITKVLKIQDCWRITYDSSDWIRARAKSILGKVKLIIAVDRYISELLGRQDSTSGHYFQALESCFKGAAGLDFAGLWYIYGDKQSIQKTMEDVVIQLCRETEHDTPAGPGPTGLRRMLEGAIANEMEVELHVRLRFWNSDAPEPTDLMATFRISDWHLEVKNGNSTLRIYQASAKELLERQPR